MNNSQSGASAGMMGDDVNVKSVNVAQYPATDKYTVVIVPTTNIDHVNSIELQNVELIYSDKTYKFDSIELGYDIKKAANKLYPTYHALQKDYQYDLEFKVGTYWMLNVLILPYYSRCCNKYDKSR